MLPLDRAIKKSGRFTMCVGGGTKAACRGGIDDGSDSGADRLWKKEC